MNKKDKVQELLKEINRVQTRYTKVLKKSNNDKYFSSVDDVLNRGTKEGAAFKRSLKDLRMVISETIQEI